MSFKENLLNARSYIFMILGILAAFLLIYYLEGFSPQNKAGLHGMSPTFKFSANRPVRENRKLTPHELEYAKIAWKYFEKNYQDKTGLVNSVDSYPATTLWDTASYLLGMISAQKLEIISETPFRTRIEKILPTLLNLPLTQKGLPNKSYQTTNALMSTYTNETTDTGIGTSTIDVGRILVPFIYLTRNYPEYYDMIQDILRKWNLESMLQDGVMVGMDEHFTSVQEGRLGYEEYASKGFINLGGDAYMSVDYLDFTEFKDIYGVQLPIDSRSPEEFGARNWVVSDPYILDHLEYGGDTYSKEFAYRIYLAQVKRYEEINILTAVTEDHIDRAPYFVYNSIYENGKTWVAMLDTGENADAHKTLSVKAVFGWYALYSTDYTHILLNKVKNLYDPQAGWYAGWYEIDQKPNKALTANTNGIILEALHYIQFGKLLNPFSINKDERS